MLSTNPLTSPPTSLNKVLIALECLSVNIFLIVEYAKLPCFCIIDRPSITFSISPPNTRLVISSTLPNPTLSLSSLVIFLKSLSNIFLPTPSTDISFVNNVLNTTPDCSPLLPCCFRVDNRANSRLDTSIVYCSTLLFCNPLSSALLIIAFIAVLVCLPALLTSCKSKAVLSNALCNLLANSFKFLSLALRLRAVNLALSMLVAVDKSSKLAIATLPATDTKFIDCS